MSVYYPEVLLTIRRRSGILLVECRWFFRAEAVVVVEKEIGPMKRLLRVLALAVVLAISVSVVGAQGPEGSDVGVMDWGSGIVWTSSLQIQNLDTSKSATVEVCYYSQASPGSPTCLTPPFSPLASGASGTIFPLPDSLGTTFNGSAVVSSDAPLAAVSNMLSTDFKYGGAYEGISEGATQVSLPIVQYRNAGRYFSQFNVQNAGTSQATATCSFYREGQASASTSVDLTIEVGAAQTVDPQTLAWFQTNVPAPNKWVGSVVCESTNGVAIVAVSELLDTSGPSGTGLYVYSGFTGSGADQLYLSTIMENNANYWTGVNVQNLGPGTADITMEFIPEAGYPAKSPQTITGVGEGATAVFLQGATGAKWVGAAQVSSSGGQNLHAVVNILNTAVGEGSSYAGLPLAMATDTIYAPLIMQANGGYWTSINVMNLSGSQQTVTVDYYPSPGYGAKPQETRSVTDNSVGVFLQGGTTKWVGSAVISVPSGGKIIAIVNELNTSKAEPAESMLTYNAFNQ
jgi:hypothetical protein